jgi:hypothetical protein
MSINYTALSAWAAVAAALGAAAALWTQLRSSRVSLGFDLLLRLDERFNGGEMLKTRRKAAKEMLEGADPHLDDILDFFEMIGMLVRRGVLDGEMVWHSFFYWLNSYWHLASARISQARTEDATVWADLTTLYAKLVKLERKERGLADADVVPSKDSLLRFLESEAGLSSDPSTEPGEPASHTHGPVPKSLWLAVLSEGVPKRRLGSTLMLTVKGFSRLS